MEKKKIRIAFAPIQGYTDYMYRNLHSEVFGGVDMYYSPFLRLLPNSEFRNKDIRDIEPHNNRTSDFIPQILSGSTDELKRMLDVVVEMNHTQVDINMGCPFRMVAGRNKGAGILSDRTKVEELLKVCESYSKSKLKISLKMRLGWDDTDSARNLLPLFSDYDINHIVLHPRLGIQEYKGNVDLDAFERFYKECKLPLYYNGDIRTLDDFKKIHLRFPNLDGVVIGRGLLANPNLANEIKAYIDKGEIMSEDEYVLKSVFMSKCKQFHKMLLDANAEYLKGGEHQVLKKMQTLWDYFLPDTEKKILKHIRKTSKLGTYKIYVDEAFKL